MSAAQDYRQTPTLDFPRSTVDPLSALVAAAVDGDHHAWGVLYTRYEPLISSVSRRYRLTAADAEDLSQVVWLRLVEHLGRLREPRALPGWIATTAKNEALRMIEFRRCTEPADPIADHRLDKVADCEFDERLHRLELRRELRRGLAELSPQHRELLLVLLAEPDVSYRDISKRLGMPTGSIGPTRARCLQKLRATKAIQALEANQRAQMAR